MSDTAPSAETPFLFDDSRRLTGPNRHFDRPAVVLSALGAAADDADAHRCWAARVSAVCAVLRWPDPQPHVHRHASGFALAFAAPEDALFTATEVNEWAWERCAAGAGFAFAQPEMNDPAAVAATFAVRAESERSRPLARLKAAALAHGLPCFDDDDTLSIGAGAGSVSYPHAALPLAMDVPWSRLRDLPTILVTGSNGKTTTTRLLAAMAAAAGRRAGSCSTEGVVVGEKLVASGDYAGPAGARAVLRHPGVEFAALETARGGLLRRGLAVRRADAAVVTNVSADHFGEYGVHSLDDIAEVKLVVAHALRNGGCLILNAADECLMRVAARTPHAVAASQALFAQNHEHPALQARRGQGGSTCGARAGRLVLSADGVEHELGAVGEMPLTMGGAARHNLDNIAAAVLAAQAAGLPLHAVRETLSRFGSQPQDNPGRLERWTHRGATVLIDYAHNPDGLGQLLQVAHTLKPQRLGLLLGQAGNRDDDAIADLARTAARAVPDLVVIKELPLMLRGRLLGEVPALIERELRAGGVAQASIQHHADEAAAAEWLLQWSRPGDVVVLPLHTAAVRARVSAVLTVR
ncbi:MAG: Mur ligase family protein [Pseudomonadota bacterium]